MRDQLVALGGGAVGDGHASGAGQRQLDGHGPGCAAGAEQDDIETGRVDALITDGPDEAGAVGVGADEPAVGLAHDGVARRR